MRRGGAAAALAALTLAGSCRTAPEPTRAPDEPAPAPARFEEAAAEAGISFRHTTGAFGEKWLPETMGSGCAWLDYDADGRQDLFFANGANWPGRPASEPSSQALYRNLGGGRFEDVTRSTGLAVEAYGMGVAIGDYDNDGFPDLFLNSLGPDHLFRNRGDGSFEDVTSRAGVSDSSFGSSAAFVDFDRDGLLDLFVGNYVEWTPKTDLFCTLDGVNKSYCTPESYVGASNRLFRNRGDGAFEDVTDRAGVRNPGGKSLGVVILDENDDGWLDLAIATDTQPNLLYRNQRDGTFREVGRHVGIAFSEGGVARAGMGIDAADYDGSGRESIVITNFANEMIGLYHAEAPDLYVDDAARAGIGAPSLKTLGFGVFFFDFDLDGWLDLFVANGHVEPDVQAVQRAVTYAEPPHLFRNRGEGKFEPVDSGEALGRPMVARGAAFADYDDDGDLDIAVSTSGGPARLFRNGGASSNDWLRVALVGTRSPRDAYGARLTLEAGARRWVRTLRSSSSYLSQSEKVVTFGLARGARPERLTIRWPSGLTEEVRNLPVRRVITITEGKGITSDGRP